MHTLVVMKADSPASFIELFCSNQPLPDYLFLAVLVSFYCYLAFLYFYGGFKRTALGEFQKRPSGGSWNI